MIIVRRTGETAGIAPEAFAALSAEYSTPTHERTHGFRAVIGMYAASLQRVTPAFTHVLDAVPPLLNAPFKPYGYQSNAFLVAYDQLLRSMAEHLEDCHHILLCCFPTEDVFNANPTVKAYRRLERDYYRRVQHIVNSLKHRQGRLCLFAMYDDEIALPGYYVEGVGKDGLVGPDTQIHKGGGTAISAGRDIRFHFVHLYLVSHWLSKAYDEVRGGGIDVEYNSSRIEESMADIATRAAALPRVLYPDELLEPFPSVELLSTGGDRLIRLAYPGSRAGLVYPFGLSRYLAFSGDGVTKTFAMPYGGNSDIMWLRRLQGFDA